MSNPEPGESSPLPSYFFNVSFSIIFTYVRSPQGCECHQADEEYIYDQPFLLLDERRQFWLPEIISCLYRTKRSSLFPNLKVFLKSVY